MNTLRSVGTQDLARESALIYSALSRPISKESLKMCSEIVSSYEEAQSKGDTCAVGILYRPTSGAKSILDNKDSKESDFVRLQTYLMQRYVELQDRGDCASTYLLKHIDTELSSRIGIAEVLKEEPPKE